MTKNVLLKPDNSHIERLQKYLSAIRKVAGWSSERLAELLGISRPVIVALETRHYNMTVTQYIAIRALLNGQIKLTGNDILGRVINILVDRDDISESKKDKITEQIVSVERELGHRNGTAALSEKIVQSLDRLFKSDL